ncbi:leucyl aminopeptidase family protein, partial [Deinococcus sp. 14RED07]|nr:leucyl aminopeptidase family protein [Deinococcus sp. 14RED07]
MPLVQKLERADLTLSFVGPDDADRVTRDLKPGEVRLRARRDSHDEAAALAPASPD